MAATTTTATTSATATAAANTITASGVTLAPGFEAKGTYAVYVAETPGAALVKKQVPHSLPGDDEVIVRIVASGVCASDVDGTAGKFGPIFTFPIVAGHEGVGYVVATGKNVKELKIGSRVGLGCFRDSCNSCKQCHNGRTNLCPGAGFMWGANGAQGTFSEYMRIKSRFAIAIPDTIAASDLEECGPMFCAGATVYAPFLNHHIKAGDKIGVIGVGGLGHLALKIGKAWGCDVTALSRDKSKEKTLLELGAHHFVDTKADPELKTVAGAFDFVLFCNSGSDVNWKAIVNSLAPSGTVVLLGTSGFSELKLDPMALLFGERKVAGSAAGSLATYNSMVSFFAQHKILPQNEKFAFEDINAVFDKVRAGTLRYRAVVSWGLNKPTATAPAATAAAAAKK